MTMLSVIGVSGFVLSVLFGWKGPASFGMDVTQLPLPKRLHQHWLNFAGSIFGWAALIVVIERLHDVSRLGVWDVAATLVAFWGVTGYLPYVLLQVILPNLRDILKKLSLIPDSDSTVATNVSGEPQRST